MIVSIITHIIVGVLRNDPETDESLWPNQKAIEVHYTKFLYNASLDFHYNTSRSFDELGWTTGQREELLHSELGKILKNEFLLKRRCPIKGLLKDFHGDKERAKAHGKKWHYRIANIPLKAGKSADDLKESIRRIVRAVNEAVKKLLNMDIADDDWIASVLESGANADIQALHCDIDLDIEKERLNNMVEVMIALEDETQ